MNLLSDSPLKIYFSGICGTATASLAILMKNRGHEVQGSDENIYPPMSDLLEQNQIRIDSGFHQSNLEPKPDLVVIGNALSRGNPEVEAILDMKLTYISMAELLKEHFIRGKTSLVVTGTHGKTTTSSMLGLILLEAKLEPTLVIGGIVNKFNTNNLSTSFSSMSIIDEGFQFGL